MTVSSTANAAVLLYDARARVVFSTAYFFTPYQRSDVLFLIDPNASSADVLPVAPSTWTAMESLALRCGANVGGINFDLLRRQVMDWRGVTAHGLAGAGEQRLSGFLHCLFLH